MKTPAICIWLKIYCVVMLILLGAVVAMAVYMIVAPEALLKNDQAYRTNPEQASALLAFFGFAFAFIFGLPMIPMLLALFWPRGKSAWYVGVAAIIGGFFTPIGWLATIPLVIFWLRPNVKEYFGFEPAKFGGAGDTIPVGEIV